MSKVEEKDLTINERSFIYKSRDQKNSKKAVISPATLYFL